MPAMDAQQPVTVGVGAPAIEDVVAVARHGAPVALSEDAIARDRAHAAPSIDALVEDTRPHYGVSTGFGALAGRHIPPPLRTELQRSLIRSTRRDRGPRSSARSCAR